MLRILLALIAYSAMVNAQSAAPPLRAVHASAQATVEAKPDRAELRIGVTTEAPTARDAAGRNASDTTKVLNKMKGLIGEKGVVQTANYSITPQYQYSNNARPKLTGYQATNTVVAIIDDLSMVASVLDGAIAEGANGINGIAFSVRDEEPYRLQAIAEAAKRARTRGEAMAKSLGVEVVNVAEAATTEAVPVRPVPMMMARAVSAAEAAPPTPIESGTLQIQATVTVTLQIR